MILIYSSGSSRIWRARARLGTKPNPSVLSTTIVCNISSWFDFSVSYILHRTHYIYYSLPSTVVVFFSHTSHLQRVQVARHNSKYCQPIVTPEVVRLSQATRVAITISYWCQSNHHATMNQLSHVDQHPWQHHDQQ